MDSHDRPCRSCNSSISLADFEQGRAVMVMKRAYCGPCSERIASSGVRTTPRMPRLYALAAITVGLAVLLYFLAHRPF